MITKQTYFDWTSKNTLPADKDLKEGDALIRLLTKDGKDWSAVEGDALHTELVDNHLLLLNRLAQPVKRPAVPKKNSVNKPSIDEKKPLTEKQKKQAATVKSKGASVKSVQKTRSADSRNSVAKLKQKAKDRKQTETKESTESSSKSTAAVAGKTVKRADKTKGSSAKAAKSEKPQKPAKASKPTKADLALEAYQSAEKVGAVVEEIRHIKSFVSLVRKSTQEQIINACKRLQRAFTTRKIRKTSALATEVKEIESAYIEAAKRSPYKIKLSDERLAHYVQLVGGQKVYKSIELVNKFIGWGQTERTAEQVKKFLAEIKNASGKINETDPYADRVKQIVKVLEGVKAKATFALEESALSGLAGTLGCLCDGKGVSGTPAKSSKKGLAGLDGEADWPVTLRAPKSSFSPTTVSNSAPVDSAGSNLPVKPRWPGTMSSHEVMAIDYPTYDFRDDPATNDWGTLFGRPQNPFAAMFSGAPGAGKSTLLMQLAVYLAKNFGETLYISSEEYPSFTLADKLERAGGAVKGLSFSKMVGEIRKEHKFVIIDSSTHVGLTLKEFLALRERFPSTSFILILQYTKDGKFRGGNEWPHEVDAVFYIEAGVVVTTKNRFVREPGTITVFKD